MIDGHIHYAESLEAERLQYIIEAYGLSGVALQCIQKGGKIPVEEDAFSFKRQSSVPVYIFGGLDRRIFSLSPGRMAEALPGEIDRLMTMGCDGIKMLEGKPNVRKEYPVPDFDDEIWEEYWDVLEKRQIPVYMHVNDPEEFWDESKVSEYARKAGWFYDETYVNNQEQYRQMQEVLKRHPRLRILFPHFFFLSKDLGRLAAMLDQYPNVHTDVTPGIELYFNLSDQEKEAKAFFAKYQNRICFGTDIGARSLIYEEPIPLSIEESRSRLELTTRFLEEKGDYILYPDGYYFTEGKERLMHGLGLSAEILKKIYHDNFLKFIS